MVPEAITALNRALGADNAPHALWDLAERLGAPRSLAQLGLTDDDLTVAAGPPPRRTRIRGRSRWAGRWRC